MLQNYAKPSHGYYYMIGAFDAMQGQNKRAVLPGDEIYQADYDAGYEEGRWNTLILDRTTM